MSRPEPVRPLPRWPAGLLLVLALPWALTASSCGSSDEGGIGGDSEPTDPCRLTVQNATGFDFTAISVAGADLASSATADGAASTLDIGGSSSSVTVGASDAAGRSWNDGSLSCPTGGSASVTINATHRTLADDRCTVDLFNESGLSLSWEIYVYSIDWEDYDETTGDDLADGDNVVYETSFRGTAEFYAWSENAGFREWDDGVPSCGHGQLVTLTIDDSNEVERFECGDGSSVPYYWQCDGYEDCNDGSDELACPTCDLNVANNTSETLETLDATHAYEEGLTIAPNSIYLLAEATAPEDGDIADLYAYSLDGTGYWTEYSCSEGETVDVELTNDDLK